MALDTTVGGAQADSYLDVAAGDTLAAESLSSFATDWTAATSARKENALRQATRDVDLFVGPLDLWSADQALRFPRETDVDDALAPYIPDAVQRATWEQAAFLLGTQKLRDDATRRRARGMFSFSEDEGPSGTLAVDAQLGRMSPEAERLLRGVLRTTRGAATSGSIPILTTYNVIDRGWS